MFVFFKSGTLSQFLVLFCQFDETSNFFNLDILHLVIILALSFFKKVNLGSILEKHVSKNLLKILTKQTKKAKLWKQQSTKKEQNFPENSQIKINYEDSRIEKKKRQKKQSQSNCKPRILLLQKDFRIPGDPFFLMQRIGHFNHDEPAPAAGRQVRLRLTQATCFPWSCWSSSMLSSSTKSSSSF